MGGRVAQRSNNDGDEGSEVSSAAIKALRMIASRARQNKASCSLKKNDG
jgi:hypothetical protein